MLSALCSLSYYVGSEIITSQVIKFKYKLETSLSLKGYELGQSMANFCLLSSVYVFILNRNRNRNPNGNLEKSLKMSKDYDETRSRRRLLLLLLACK